MWVTTMTRRPDLEAGLRAATDAMRYIAKHPREFPRDSIVIPIASLSAGRRSLLTPSRWRAFEAIRHEGPFESVEALALRLRRPMARVSQDVQVLSRMRLILTQRNGHRKRIEADPRPILLA